jgi:hypothetical protein
VSAQVVRTVLHSIARTDRGELNNERGVIDLDSTRRPDLGEYVSVFDVAPTTQGGYAGFLEGVVALAPDLPKPAKRTPRVPADPVEPPPDVVQIPTCSSDHGMHSDVVTCADCGEEFIREFRYSPYVAPERDRGPTPLWSPLGDTPHRSADPHPDWPKYWPVYDRVPSA